MNTPNKKEFLRLVDAYLAGKANVKQSATVEQYFDLFSTQPDILETLDKKAIREIHDRLKAGIDLRIKSKERPGFILNWKYTSVAAAVLFICSIGIYFYRSDQQQVKPFSKNATVLPDVAPGGNKAVLTLANGSKISLTDARAGIIANQFGVSIHKTKNGELVYTHPEAVNQLVYNSIETPKGGQYRLTLPDGTKVWLNAASSLRYPLTFPGNERKVELTGEAYFEVAKNKAKPFKVFTDRQVVEVLGTHFDINAYADEAATRTSLLEGSVKVSSLKSGNEIKIRPGQQAIVSLNISVKNIDVDEAVAWKNGYFMFDEEPLESILRKISRWYDVDIQYSDDSFNKKIYLNGTLSKYSNVSKVLKKLELTGAVHFKIEERKIIVLP